MRGFLTPFIATHFGISTSNRSSCPFGQPSLQLGRSPTAKQLKSCLTRSFGARLEPRYIFGAACLDQ